MRTLFLVICCFALMIGKSQNINGKKFILDGMVYNRDTGYIILRFTNSSDKWIRDTTFLKKGKFKFEGEIKEPVRAIISGYKKIIDFEEVNYTNIFIEPGIQKIELIENAYVDAKMDGSYTQKESDTLNMHLNSIKARFQDIYQQLVVAKNMYKAASTPKEKEFALQKESVLIGQLKPAQAEIKHEVTSFILQHPNSYVSPFFLYATARELPVDSAKALFHTLTPRIQNSIIGKDITDLFRQKEQNAIGKEPYSFNAQDINGKNVSLLSFKGKFLYIDFWASWCAPCRAEIPHIKKLFEQYNSKGLEILTISIDKDSVAWKVAVVKEQISRWHNILVNKEIENNYENVNNPIPSGMLIAQDGKIVWKSGKQETLEEALKRIIK
ncbi:MAG: TlpA disulfide reductase family protein [Sediminibacterium sp.]|nr:TlpA disulfide reductase family protein [Sediminibacterium sp.]